MSEFQIQTPYPKGIPEIRIADYLPKRKISWNDKATSSFVVAWINLIYEQYNEQISE